LDDTGNKNLVVYSEINLYNKWGAMKRFRVSLRVEDVWSMCPGGEFPDQERNQLWNVYWWNESPFLYKWDRSQVLRESTKKGHHNDCLQNGCILIPKNKSIEYYLFCFIKYTSLYRFIVIMNGHAGRSCPFQVSLSSRGQITVDQKGIKICHPSIADNFCKVSCKHQGVW